MVLATEKRMVMMDDLTEEILGGGCCHSSAWIVASVNC